MPVPVYEADLFSDEALDNPYGHYRALRDVGPVVYLSAHDLHAVARYAEVRHVLRASATCQPKCQIALCGAVGGGRSTLVNNTITLFGDSNAGNPAHSPLVQLGNWRQYQSIAALGSTEFRCR